MDRIIIFILVASIVFGYIFWPKIFHALERAQTTKNFFKKLHLITALKNFTFRVNPLYFLLSLIAIILFFGLFKTEIKTWQIKNWSNYFEVVDIKGSYSCQKQIDNPNYDEEWNEWNINNVGMDKDPKFLSCLENNKREFGWERRSLCELNRVESMPQKRIWITATCQGVIMKEVWLKVFGVKIWKNSSQEINPSTGRSK